MLSPLKFLGRLTSNFMWGILERVSTKVIEIMLIQLFFHFCQIFLNFFFRPFFKHYLLWSLWTDWLQIPSEASWGGSLLRLWKLYRLSISGIFCNLFIFSAQFSNAISSEVPGSIDFNFYVRHPGEGLYQGYGNYADAAILSAERQGPWASCYVNTVSTKNSAVAITEINSFTVDAIIHSRWVVLPEGWKPVDNQVIELIRFQEGNW